MLRWHSRRVNRGANDPAPPFIHHTMEWTREKRPPPFLTSPHMEQVNESALPLIGYTHRRAGPAPYLGSTLELTLLAGSQVSQPCGCERKKAAHSTPSFAMWWHG